jgi:hypothetical protein
MWHRVRDSGFKSKIMIQQLACLMPILVFRYGILALLRATLTQIYLCFSQYR